MSKMPMKKKMDIIRLYFEGHSYDEISTKTHTSKGSVSNIITELKAGKFPEYGDLSEQLDTLRELANELKNRRQTVSQSMTGVIVLSRLEELGIELNNIEPLYDLSRTLNENNIEKDLFIKAALNLEEERERTGLSVAELDTRVRELQETAGRFEPLKQRVDEQQSQLDELNAQIENLVKKKQNLEKSNVILSGKVREKEQRETELSSRVIDLEEREYVADEKLAVARQDLKKLSTIGMSTENLIAFAQRLAVIAQRHGIKPQIVSNRLFEELEQLDEGLGLDLMIKEKKKELQKTKAEIVRKKGRVSSLHLEVEDLRSEKTSLENTIKHERNQVISGLNSIRTAVELTISGLNKKLDTEITKSMDEMNKYQDRAVEMGKELGGIQENIESRRWLRDLWAIVDNNDDIESGQVKEILTKITKGMLPWLDRHKTDISISYSIRLYIDCLAGELERWRI